MGYEEESGYAPEEVDEYQDRRRDYGYDLPTNWNLSHLTLSQLAIDFFAQHESLHDLMPLVDQIMSTSRLDERGVDLYRCMINSQIAEVMLWTDEDDDKGFRALNTARIYLFMLLEGMRGGYRGRLATEVRRVYRREREEPAKGRGLFR